MKRIHLGSMLCGLFLILVLFAPCFLRAPDAPIQPNFITYSVKEKNDGAPGTFGWKPFVRPSKTFSLTFKAIKANDLFISIKGGISQVDIVIGGWGNTHGAIHYFENGAFVTGYWVCSEEKPVDGCIKMPGCASIIPDGTNPVEYTMTVLPGLKEGEGICRVVAKKKDGTSVKILETSHQWFSKVFSAYSFKAWNGPVQIADDSATLFDSGCWFKVASNNKYLQVTSAGFLQVVDRKPDVAPFSLQKDPSDASKKVILGRDLNKYVVVRNLQLLDSDNLYNAVDNSSKIYAEETALDPTSFGRQFIFEAEGSGVKIKNASGTLTTYLRVDADGCVRAFKPDPTKGNKYVAPITKAEATLFVVEESAITAAPLNSGDIVALRFQDGSYLSFDLFKRGGEERCVRPNTIGLMDPSTHFKVFNYPDEWKERGLIAFSTYGYDVALDDSADSAARAKSLSELGHGLFADYNAANNWPTRMRVAARKDAPVYHLEYDAISASKQKFSFGFAGSKVLKNASNMPIDAVIVDTVDASTPVGDYKFEIVKAIGQHQRLLEGAALPASLPVQNICTAAGVTLMSANLYPWDLNRGLVVTAPYVELAEGYKQGFIATFECNAAADLNIGLASRPWIDVAMGYCYGLMQLHAGSNNNTQCVYDKANVVNKQTPYGLNPDKTQYSPDITKFTASAVLPAPGAFTKYRLIADFQSPATRKLALEGLGSDSLYHEIFSVPFGSDQNMPNPPVDQDGIKFLGFRCGSAGFTVKNLSIRELSRGQAASSAPMTLAVAKDDVANKFKPAFEAVAKSAEDWAGLVELFKNYMTLTSALDKFTEPEGSAPASSLRDKAVALIATALTTAPANVKPALQDLQAFLMDIPTWLPNPATPPTANSDLAAGKSLAFKISDDLYLGIGADGKLGAVRTSTYDPAIHFTVLGYDPANGRLAIGLGEYARSIPTALEYLRVYQAADQSLSLGLTQIARAVDVVVNQNPASTISFSYAGVPVTCTPASLGLTSGGSVRNFIPVALVADKLQQDKCLRLRTDRKMPNGQLATDILSWGSVFKRGSQTFSEYDWNFYAKGLSDYALKAQSIADDWNSPVTDAIQKLCVASLPEVVVAGSCGATNGEFLQRVLAYMLNAPGITAVARDNLVKCGLAFAPLKPGSRLTLKTNTGTYLSKETVDGKAVMRASVTSTYSATTQFEVAEFNTTGVVVLKSSDGLFLARDAATGDLVFKRERSELGVQYDLMQKKIKLGGGGKFAQVDGLSGNVKITADATTALSLEIKVQASSDSQVLAGIDKDSLEIAVVQKMKPIFTALAGKTDSDWKYLLSVLSGYVQTKLVTPEDYVAWGVQRDSLAKRSVRDEVVSFVTAVSAELQKQPQAAQSPLKDSLSSVVAQCASLLTKLQDIPVYVDSAGASPQIDGIALQAVVSLKVSDGMYLTQDGATLKAVKTLPLDPATHVLVTAYDQSKGRAIFKIGEKYLDISPAVPYTFVLKDTPRFVAVRRHDTVAKKFSFALGGAIVSFDQSKLGVAGASPVKEFEITGPLSGVQKSFKDVLLHMASAPTVEIVKADIQACFDPLFTQLGMFDGDWLYYVQKFDAYLRFISTTIRLDSVQLSGVRGGSIVLKDYATRVFSSIAGQYSAAAKDAPDAQTAAAKTFAWLSGGASAQAATNSDALFSAGDRVFLQVLGQDSVTKQKLGWTSGKLVRAQELPVIDKSVHFTVLAYDASAQSIVLGFSALVFDPTTRTFVAKQIKDVQSLVLQPVDVAGTTYYYLKNAAGARLAAGSDGVAFNATGDLFDLAKISQGLLLLDAVGVPASATDLEQGLAKFVTAFDATAMDSASLSYVLSEFEAFCTKAALVPAWSTEKSSAGSTFKEYARLLLTVITKSPGYTGLTAALSEKVAQMISSPVFAVTAATVVDAVDAKKTPVVPSVGGVVQQTPYQQLDGNKGNPTVDLPIFNDALEKAHESTDELASVLKALSGYINAAAKRFDWYAQGVVFGSSVPRDYAIAMLQRVIDNDWFFTGLADSKPVQDCIESAKNQAASYPVQLTILDSYAKEIVSPEALSASARLIKLLKNLVAEMRLVGSSQLRMQLLKKIELYFDKAMVPALKIPKFDVQKNAWSLLLFGLQVQLLSSDVTSLELLDEKIAAFEQVLIPRLKMLDADVQLDAISNLLGLVTPMALGLVKLVPDLKGARFTKFVAVVFTYIDFVVKQNAQDDELTDDQKQLVSTIQSTIQASKVVLGLEANTLAVVVAPKVVVPKTVAPVPVAPAVVTVSPPSAPKKTTPALNLATSSLAGEFSVPDPSPALKAAQPAKSKYVDEFTTPIVRPSITPAQRQAAPVRSLEI